MIPLEFSYMKVIVGDKGQGRGLIQLPSICKELLSYVSSRFFMEGDDHSPVYQQPVHFYPAGNIVTWEFENEFDDSSSFENGLSVSTDTSNKSHKILIINKIKRYIFLNFYAQDIDIDGDVLFDDQRSEVLQSMYLLSTIGSVADSQLFWLYTDPVTAKENETQTRSGINRNEFNPSNEPGIICKFKEFFFFHLKKPRIHHPYNSKSPPVLGIDLPSL